MKKKQENPEKEQVAVDNRIAAVRDLIFGENMQQYSHDFDDVYNKIKLKEDTSENLSNTTTQLEDRINELEARIEKSIEDLSSDMTKRLDEIDDAKADRVKLGKALEKIALMLQE